MSQRIELWQLNHDDQDILWINNKCPKCDVVIFQREENEDFATWLCSECGNFYIVE